jgi:gamma-glutamyltranspeptidase/glutathione hydrolase
MSFSDIAAPAIRFARDGFSIFAYIAEQIVEHAEEYAYWPSNAAIFLPGGRPPRIGERFVQEDLARTIQYMADEERSAQGTGRLAGLEAARAAFYCGEIAEQIDRFYKQEGGYLRLADLTSFRSRYEAPVRVRWRDFTLITCGPWCQGPVLSQALLTVERAGISGYRHNSADYVHLIIEILKGAFADREYRYGDPRFVDVGLSELLSDAHIARRLKDINMTRAHPELPPPLGGVSPLSVPEPRSGSVRSSSSGGTSFVCVVDRWGNALSATPSDGSYSSPVVPGTGIVPSERGMQSRADPSHPSGVAPGKRPRLTPNPAIAIRDDGSVFAFGCPGGDMQVQAMLQVFLNMFHFGMDVQDAINAPRFATWNFPNSFEPFDYLRNRVTVEDRFDESLTNELERRGHDVELWPAFTRRSAAVEAIYADAASGFLRAGADPRQPAYAIVS